MEKIGLFSKREKTKEKTEKAKEKQKAGLNALGDKLKKISSPRPPHLGSLRKKGGII